MRVAGVRESTVLVVAGTAKRSITQSRQRLGGDDGGRGKHRGRGVHDVAAGGGHARGLWVVIGVPVVWGRRYGGRCWRAGPAEHCRPVGGGRKGGGRRERREVIQGELCKEARVRSATAANHGGTERPGKTVGAREIMRRDDGGDDAGAGRGAERDGRKEWWAWTSVRCAVTVTGQPSQTSPPGRILRRAPNSPSSIIPRTTRMRTHQTCVAAYTAPPRPPTTLAPDCPRRRAPPQAARGRCKTSTGHLPFQN